MIENRKIEDIVIENISEYAKATFYRAFPYFADGLKPVVRRIIYTMYEEHIENSFRKVAYVTGTVMGKYHPHGDSSIYVALVNMAQPFNINYPLIDGQGNFGAQNGDPPSAARYIECRLSDFCKDVITSEIDDQSIDYENNYDDRYKEPVYLPSKIPLLLVEGSSGLGEAFAVNIPPHNLSDVVRITKMYIDDNDIHLKDLVKNFYPDFPTGGEIINGNEIYKLYSEGTPCTLKIRSTYVIDQNNSTITLNDLPYGVTLDVIKEQIRTAAMEKNIECFKDILHVNEQYDRKNNRMYFEIICKKDGNLTTIMNNLYKFTDIQTSRPISFMANFDGKVKSVNIKDIIENWYNVRVSCKKRKFTYEISKIQGKKHVLEGLYSAYDRIDEIIDTIRKHGNTKQETIEILSKKFKLTQIQAKGICEMQLISLSRYTAHELKQNIEKLNHELIRLNNDLDRIPQIIKEEMDFIENKYRRHRMTKIISVSENSKSEDKTVESGVLMFSRNCVGIFEKHFLKKNKNILNGMKFFKLGGEKYKEILGVVDIKKPIKGYVVFYSDNTAKKYSMASISTFNVWFEQLIDQENYIRSVAPYENEEQRIIIVNNKESKIKIIKVSDIGDRQVNVGNVDLSISIYDEENVLLVDTNSFYLKFPISDVPELGRTASGVNLVFENPIVSAIPMRKEIVPTDRIILGISDAENIGYFYSVNTSRFKDSRRTNKPKQIIDIGNKYKVISASLVDCDKRTNDSLLIGRSNVSSLKLSNYRKEFEMKRIGMGLVKLINY